MKIAFLSYEFPPDTGGGGIGTYLEQVTRHLGKGGLQIEVFAGTDKPSYSFQDQGILVHRIRCSASSFFAEAVLHPFLERNRSVLFDVIEAADFDAPALQVKKRLPSIPLIVKLHTPRFVIDELHWRAPRPIMQLRMTAGALCKGELPRGVLSPYHDRHSCRETEQLRLADEIASPSSAIARRLLSQGLIDPLLVSVFPYPFEPAKALLDLPIQGDHNKHIIFLGRLEKRKGVYDVAAAIPAVLRAVPTATFEFVGKSVPTTGGRQVADELAKALAQYAPRVSISGPVPYTQVAAKLSTAAIQLAPSHWESFGLVCCEGMAAARCVVGSWSGGMSEILEDRRTGRLVAPGRPAELSRSIIELLRDPQQRATYSSAAREEVLRRFDWKRVEKQQMDSYRRAKERNRSAI